MRNKGDTQKRNIVGKNWGFPYLGRKKKFCSYTVLFFFFYFPGTNKHFLIGGEVEGFHFLSPLPLAFSEWKFQKKSILCLKMAKDTFCNQCLCLPLFSHTF